MYRKLLRQAAKDFHLSLEAFGEDLRCAWPVFVRVAES
jgi:hypothetical protein